MRSWTTLGMVLWMAGCVGDGTAPGDLTWYINCGDPSCRGYDGPFADVPLCTAEADGDPCSTDGATCDPENKCNALLVCATEDPKDQTGGCPISKAEVKRDVSYLDAPAVQAAADRALSVKLATWHYRWEDDAVRPHLGFLIDDQAASPAVRADGERVDLYGYTSLAIAAVQAQQAEIAAMRQELAELKARVETCE